MLDIIDKRDDVISEIDYEISLITQHKASKSEQIKPIHPDLNIYSNSINIYCGLCGSGKSTAILREVIKLTNYTNVIHLMLYVTKYGSSNDTFKTLEPMLTQNDDYYHKPTIIQVADANLISVINKIHKWKQL
jgi:ABC-type polar amino acid transport system ATPase subunit